MQQRAAPARSGGSWVHEGRMGREDVGSEPALRVRGAGREGIVGEDARMSGLRPQGGARRDVVPLPAGPVLRARVSGEEGEAGKESEAQAGACGSGGGGLPRVVVSAASGVAFQEDAPCVQGVKRPETDLKGEAPKTVPSDC